MINLTELYCKIDDFDKGFEIEFHKHLLSTGRIRLRSTELSVSEMMTIVIRFHHSVYRDFKIYYTKHVCVYYKNISTIYLATLDLFSYCLKFLFHY